MASAALSATSCSQLCLTHLNATAHGPLNPSCGVASPSLCSSSALLNSSHRAPRKDHHDRRKLLSRRSQFCGQRISNSLELLSGLFSSHSCPRVTAHFGRVETFSRWHVSGLGSKEYETPLATSFRTHRGTASVVCRGAAAAVAEIATLKPFLDKLILLGTVMYYYIAGVSALPRLPELAPGIKRVSSSAAPKFSAPKPVKKKRVLQQQKPRQQVSNEDTWLALDSKLSSALSQDEIGVEEQHSINPLLSLQAFARGPRQYLLHTTLHHLRKEVENITEAEQDLSPSQWRDLSLVVLSRTVLPVCRNWVSQDFTVKNQALDAAKGFHFAGQGSAGEGAEIISLTQSQVVASMTDFLKDTDSVRTYLTKTGKAELYADLLFFLRFGSVRTGGCCDYRSFTRFAGSALEDMVVVVAEVVATLFLDSCSSVVTLSPQSETWQAFLLPSVLSTRSLERFRNEVALNGWLNQNFASVVAMFEDRFDLWTLRRPNPSPSADKAKQVKARKPEDDKTGIASPGLLLIGVQLPARRSDELKALTGWRYYYSLYLELSDVVGPILGIFLTRLGEAVSFLLVRLIGRSLGLVYQGIRQSVRWSPK